MSNPTDEDWKRMIKLVDTFYNRSDAEPFRNPVDWKAYGLTDYPQIIKHPMDLGSIRTKLKKSNYGGYKTLYQVAEDVRLVWTNCMTYNADGSDFYKLADQLQKRWDEKYTKLLQECSSGGGSAAAAAAAAASATAAATTTGGSDKPKAARQSSADTNSDTPGSAAAAAGAAANSASSASKVSLQERKNFAKSLYQISKEDLGRILVQVEQKCPAAIVRNATEDEVEFNIDKLSAALLQELTTFIQNSTSASNNKDKDKDTNSSKARNSSNNNTDKATASSSGSNTGTAAARKSTGGATSNPEKTSSTAARKSAPANPSKKQKTAGK